MRLKDLCVVGNISTDGRWIRIPTSIWECIVNTINTTDAPNELDNTTMKIIDCLCEIHVLVDENDAMCDSQLLIQPREITMELTTQCNLKCKHCSYSFGGKKYDEMPFDTVIAVARWCSDNKVDRIILTGGEPFCRKDIIKLIKEIRTCYSGSVEIMTNATLICDSNMLSIIENVDRLHISLDGYDEKSVASIRGHRVFERVTTVIRELQTKGFTDISLSCVDTGDVQKITCFKELAQRLRVEPIIRRLNLKGQANINFNYENSSSFELLTSNGINMKSLCHHSYTELFINTRSQVFPCAALREMKYSIGEFLAEERKFVLNYESVTPVVDNIEECSCCPVKYFCTTPCISQNDVIFLNKEYRIKQCSQLRKKLFNIVWGVILL